MEVVSVDLDILDEIEEEDLKEEERDRFTRGTRGDHMVIATVEEKEEVSLREVIVHQDLIIIILVMKEDLSEKEVKDHSVIETLIVHQDLIRETQDVNLVRDPVSLEIMEEKEDHSVIEEEEISQIVEVIVLKVEELMVVEDQVDLKDLQRKKLWPTSSQILNLKEEVTGEETRKNYSLRCREICVFLVIIYY